MIHSPREFFCQNRGYFVIFGGFLVHFSLGSFYTYGNIQPYVVEYMQNCSLSGKYVNMGNTMWIFGLKAFGMGTSVSAGGFLNEKIGPLLTVLIGGLFYSLNVSLTYFTIKSYLFVIAISDGLLAGLGMGVAYGVALGTPCKWFPNRKGVVIGIIVAGFGLSASVFNHLQVQYIKQGSEMNPCISENVPKSYYIFGLTYMAMIIIGSLFLKSPSNFDSEHTSEYSSENYVPQITALITRMHSSDRGSINVKPHQLFFEFDFWIMWLTFALNISGIVLFMSLHKDFGTMIKLSNHTLTIVSIIGALVNCAGRIFWGFINDRKSYKKTMLCLTISVTILYPTFYICGAVGNDIEDNSIRVVLYLIWTILLNFLISGNVTIFPATCAKQFGLKHVVANYGLLYTAATIGWAVTSVITTSMRDNRLQSIRLYLYSFIAGGILSLMAAGLTILYKGKVLLNYRNGLM